jgi:hypothetical protein
MKILIVPAVSLTVIGLVALLTIETTAPEPTCVIEEKVETLPRQRFAQPPPPSMPAPAPLHAPMSVPVG